VTYFGKKTSSEPVSSDMRKSKHEKFAVLIEGLSSDLYRYAYWKCRDRIQAEELAQETYLRAWKSLDSLRDAGAAKSWLFTIFRREYARQFERKRHQEVDLDGLVEAPAARPTYDTSSEAFVLRRALAELAEDYREALVLQVLGGFSCDEIAGIMNISSSAVMTRLFRARKQMRELLTQEQSGAAEVSA